MSDLFDGLPLHRLSRIERKVDAILDKLGIIQKEEIHDMATLQEILDKQTKALATSAADLTLDKAIKTAFDGQTQMIIGLQAQLQALIDAGNTTPAQLQTLSDNMDAIIAAQDTDEAAKAILAGTPPGTGQL